MEQAYYDWLLTFPFTKKSHIFYTIICRRRNYRVSQLTYCTKNVKSAVLQCGSGGTTVYRWMELPSCKNESLHFLKEAMGGLSV